MKSAKDTKPLANPRMGDIKLGKRDARFVKYTLDGKDYSVLVVDID